MKAADPIVAVPEGGLCNRMRVVDSLLALGEAVARPTKVIWEMNEALNCPFGDLFLPPAGEFEVADVKAEGRVGKLATRIRDVASRVRGCTVLQQPDVLALSKEPEKLRRLARGSRLYMRTYSRFWQASRPFASLRPVPAIAGVVQQHAPRLARSVGVHIRRTDNAASTRHSPVSAFVELMKAEQSLDAGVSFFVATDSPEVLDELRGVFGEAILSHEKISLSRSDPAAIRDAAIDLYCLAACRKLLGSYWSSFSDTAAEINGIEIVIVKQG